MKKSYFLSGCSIVILLLLYFPSLFFYYTDRVEISREDLYKNVAFAEELFSSRKINKIFLDIDFNEITVHFPPEQYDAILSFFYSRKWIKAEDKEHLVFRKENTCVYIQCDSILIKVERH